MRFRTTLILGLIFLGLGAYLYFVEMERAADDAKKETVFELDPEEITHVTLTYPDRKIALEKAEGEWKITEPVQARADDTTVNHLVRAIAEAEVKRRIEDTPQDLSPFGLDKPEVVVGVKAGDRELPALRVGKTTPIGYSTYLQKADDSKVLLTGSAFRSGMDKKLTDLRDKRIIEIEEDEVKKITLARAEGEVVIAKSNGTWRIESPAQYPADQTTVRMLLSTLGSMRATGFPEEAPSDLSKYGLGDPRLKITVGLGEEAGQKSVLLGNETDQNEIYVTTDARPTVYTVSEWVFRDLAKNVNDFRDKTILSFEKEAVRQIEVQRDGSSFTLARGDDQSWTVSGTEGVPDPMKVEQFLSGLHELEGYEITAEQPEDLARYGLAEPLVTIKLRGADEEIGTVRLGSYTTEAAATEYTAMREQEPLVFHVREYAFTRVDKKASDLLTKPTPTAKPES